MHVLDESELLLDLLREAGDEPVTLDELHVVGVQEPAKALLALELAGHSVHRVYETGSHTACVRLGAPRPPAPAVHVAPPPPSPVPRAAALPALGARRSIDPRFTAGALLALLLLLLVARRD